MTVRQFVGTMQANQRSPQEAAEDFELPVEAVEEAMRYAEKHRHLLEAEAIFEKKLRQRKGHGNGPEAVPG